MLYTHLGQTLPVAPIAPAAPAPRKSSRSDLIAPLLIVGAAIGIFWATLNVK